MGNRPLKPDLLGPESVHKRVELAIVGLGKLSAEKLIPAIRTSRHTRITKNPNAAQQAQAVARALLGGTDKE